MHSLWFTNLSQIIIWDEKFLYPIRFEIRSHGDALMKPLVVSKHEYIIGALCFNFCGMFVRSTMTILLCGAYCIHTQLPIMLLLMLDSLLYLFLSFYHYWLSDSNNFNYLVILFTNTFSLHKVVLSLVKAGPKINLIRTMQHSYHYCIHMESGKPIRQNLA